MKRKDLFPRLREEMREAGETQKDLAVVLGCCARTVGLRMMGQREWTRSEMLLVARHYDLTMDYLFA